MMKCIDGRKTDSETVYETIVEPYVYQELLAVYERVMEESWSNNIRDQYTAVREELEWKPVEGFWNDEKDY